MIIVIAYYNRERIFDHDEGVQAFWQEKIQSMQDWVDNANGEEGFPFALHTSIPKRKRT